MLHWYAVCYRKRLYRRQQSWPGSVRSLNRVGCGSSSGRTHVNDASIGASIVWHHVNACGSRRGQVRSLRARCFGPAPLSADQCREIAEDASAAAEDRARSASVWAPATPGVSFEWVVTLGEEAFRKPSGAGRRAPRLRARGSRAGCSYCSSYSSCSSYYSYYSNIAIITINSYYYYYYYYCYYSYNSCYSYTSYIPAPRPPLGGEREGERERERARSA